jgi:PAS domain S-box-containing protein
MQSTLAVERSSVHLLDEHGSMRFVAWRGLSESYRTAVEGYSPWTPNDTDPEVVLVEDVRESPRLRALLPALLAERILSCGFVPLRLGTRLAGKFMLYYDAMHAFSADEVVIAEIVAGHIAFALEHRRVAAALESRLESEHGARTQAEREAALRDESEHRLRFALSAGRMGAWEWDIATSRVEWSEELERIHGLGAKTFPGTVEAVLAEVHPDDRERFRDEIRRALEGGGDEYEIEYRIMPPDGSQRWVGAKGRVVRDAAGVPVRMAGICRDISIHKRIEEDNAKLLAEAKAAVAARDDMIQIVSHDLRNPLQSISTAAALLQHDGRPEHRHRSLETIALATAQMKRLLQDLLDISQMDAGQFSVSPESVDAAALIRETHTLFVSVAEEKRIRLECLAPPAVSIRADRGRIMQVLSNLVGNALKFVPAGGMITIGAEPRGTRVRFSVEDTGIGLSAEDQAHVFDRFWCGDRRKERGVGLGLALAKGIVEAHGGEIGVDSVLGRGCTFYFLLDAEAEAEAEAETAGITLHQASLPALDTPAGNGDAGAHAGIAAAGDTAAKPS